MDTKAKIDQRREEARKRQQALKKRENSKFSPKLKSRLIGTGCTLLVIILIAALIFPNTGLSRRMLTALTIGDTDISVAEYSYYYRTSFNNYYQTMYSYFGGEYMPIDTTKSLDKQAYSEDMTYADYFSSQSIDSLKQLVVLSSEAKKAGFTLPAEQQASLDRTLSNVKTSAQNANTTVSNYLSTNFGMGFNMSILEKCVSRELLADAYKTEKENSFTYTDAELDAYYQENHTQYDMADVRMVRFPVTEATDTDPGVTAEEAKAQADAFLEGVTSEEEFAAKALEKAQAEAAEGVTAEDNSLITNLRYSTVASTDVNVANWIFMINTQAGASEVVEAADGNGYYAIYMIKAPARSDEKTVDIRHILISASDSGSEEGMAAAKAQAEEIYQQFLSGGATEELFAQLANEHTGDSGSAGNGGLYTGVYKGQMVQSFDDWCFDEARFPGDSGIIESEYGYHIMYFVGDNLPRWQIDVKADMASADYNDWYTSVSEQYTVSEHPFAMKYRSEPF